MSDVGQEIKNSDEQIRIRSWDEIRTTGEHNKPINERVDAMTYIKPFNIKEVDLMTIKRFISYARFNAKNDWGTAMKMLLDNTEADAKEVMLYENILALKQEVEQIKAEIEKKPETKVVKTFGVKKNE